MSQALGDSQGQQKLGRPDLLNFRKSDGKLDSPSSVKIIDLRQPKVRELLMTSLQEIVDNRKNKLHQRGSKHFNKNYDQIIKDTLSKPTFKLEKSISNATSSRPEQQIISRGNLANEVSPDTSQPQSLHPLSKNDSSSSLSQLNLDSD